MRVLLVHPSPLMYSEIYLRLEPIGLERVAAAVRAAGHDVRLLDLQIFRHRDYHAEVDRFRPEAVGFSLNYLANVPEVIDLAKETRGRLPGCFIFAGGHSASFVAPEILEHADGAIDCIARGEGEAIAPRLLEAVGDPRLPTLPGVVTENGAGPAPTLLDGLDRCLPARDLARRRRKYFIGVLDPCASVEFTRGCPWDCAFCSAWTFYGRSYRKAPPEAAAEDLARIQEPNVFVVDDVAFIQSEHGFAIGREIERRGIRKQYYLETRCDVLIKNREVFAYWKRLGLRYMFLGLEAIDEDGLKLHRKRVTPAENFKALEVAREIGITVAVNIIADPDWDERRFAVIREWASGVPEIVHITVNTPYPGTETWHTESRKLTTLDYRLFDVQHAVLPTRLPLPRFYEELVKTQAVLNRKHLGVAAIRTTAAAALGLLLRGQTNFVRMLWKFGAVYNPERQYADHGRTVEYAMRPPRFVAAPRPGPAQLYVHAPAAAPRAAER
jgi:magnesium-protoporphyrin IX monomethyl ester (oxidative) cyclase